VQNTDTRGAPGRRILCVGHRGAAGHAPENTLAAIRAGLALGVDFVEVDLQRSRDGRLAVMHDASVDRTTNGKGLISDLTWEELQLLDAGNGERIPCLEEVLAEACGRGGVMLEVKAPGIGEEVQRAVRAAKFEEPVLYASFLHAELAAVRALDPAARTMPLTVSVPAGGAGFAHAADATMVGLEHHFASAECVAMLHDAGLEVFVYTVNDPAHIQRVIDLGVDGVISDYPERVLNMRVTGSEL
jgi:glycerophosphoryl diester phosphodiesterase